MRVVLVLFDGVGVVHRVGHDVGLVGVVDGGVVVLQGNVAEFLADSVSPQFSLVLEDASEAEDSVAFAALEAVSVLVFQYLLTSGG